MLKKLYRKIPVPAKTIQRTVLIELVAILILGIISITAPIPEQIKKSRVKVGKQVWAFYSGNWGNYLLDGKWLSWPIPREYGTESNFTEPPVHTQTKLYPALGLYSSHDPSVLRSHLRWAYQAGINVLIFEWWGENVTNRTHYEEKYRGNEFADYTLKLLLDLAPEFKIKIIPFIMGYEDEGYRTAESFGDDIKYLWNTYSRDQSIFHQDNLPVFGVFKPSKIPQLFQSIRSLQNISINPHLIGSYDEPNEIGGVAEDGFWGLVTQCGGDGARGSSNTSLWQYQSKEFKQRGLLFIPTVSPGIVVEPSPIDGRYKRLEFKREGGNYYDKMWEKALQVKTDVIGIASFNGWIDTSNIEPVVDRSGKELNNDTWEGKKDPEFYIKRTKYWADKFKGFL